MINNIRSLLFYFLLTLTAISGCISNRKQSDVIDLSLLKEGDTLIVQQIPQNLELWMRYHSSDNNIISLKDFISSGVVLHQEEFTVLDSLTKVNGLTKSKYLIFSPDTSKFIDLFSVTTNDDGEFCDRLPLPFSSDIDQQVVLGDKNGKRVELFFCGAEQLVESADWLNEQQVLLTLTSVQDTQHKVELYLFDLKSRVFTNFILRHNLTGKTQKENSFIDFWLSSIDK